MTQPHRNGSVVRSWFGVLWTAGTALAIPTGAMMGRLLMTLRPWQAAAATLAFPFTLAINALAASGIPIPATGEKYAVVLLDVISVSLAMGLTGGLAQHVILSAGPLRTREWWMLTVAGSYLAALAASVSWLFVLPLVGGMLSIDEWLGGSSDQPGATALLLTFALAGLALGGVQWATLRQTGSRALWWLPANAGAMSLAALTYNYHVPSPFDQVLAAVSAGGIFGLITAAALSRLIPQAQLSTRVKLIVTGMGILLSVRVLAFVYFVIDAVVGSQ